MSATPWWLDDDDQARRSRPPVDPAAVQETVAGGLALVASFLRLAADAATSGEQRAADEEVVEVEVEVHDSERADVDLEDADPEDADPEDAELEDVELGDVELDIERDDAAGEAPDADAAGHEPVAGGHHHAGTGECRSCPVCQGLALLREVNPDLVDGLGDALDALAATVRAFRPDPGRGAPWG